MGGKGHETGERVPRGRNSDLHFDDMDITCPRPINREDIYARAIARPSSVEENLRDDQLSSQQLRHRILAAGFKLCRTKNVLVHAMPL